MDILISSWSVLVREQDGILGILSILLLGGGIVFWGLKALFNDDLTPDEYFVLGMGGVILPLFLGISVTLLFAFWFGLKINFTWPCLIIFMAGCYIVMRSKRPHFQSFFSRLISPKPVEDKDSRNKRLFPFISTLQPWTGLTLILFLMGSIFIRLGFISGLIAPLYFDSAMHYSVIRDLITNFETSTLPTYNSFVGGYYHLGFHVLVAALSLALRLDVKNVLLIFGQILVAILPLPLFFILRQETKQVAPGIFAILLAGWGWTTPAYALNWGKYPALTSLLAFEFVLCCFYLLLKAPKRLRWILIGVSGLSVLLSTFIHTRSLVLIGICIISAALALGWRKLPRLVQILAFFLSLGGVLLLIFFAQSKPVLSQVFEPYQKDGIWMLILVILLSPFALKEFPERTFSILLSILFLLGSLFFSVTWLLKAYEAQTLLDRPLVEMFLFFPLAFLGGLGYAGLSRMLHNINIFQGQRRKWLNVLITLTLFGTVLVNSTQYNYSPSACCQFFREEDAVAFDWMSRNISSEANILISAVQSFIFESPSPVYTGSDGGVWITPLLHRKAEPFPNQTDFGAQSTLDSLCKSKVTHIYVGGRNESFNASQLKEHSDWYEMLLRLPKITLFKIVGCRSDS